MISGSGPTGSIQPCSKMSEVPIASFNRARARVASSARAAATARSRPIGLAIILLLACVTPPSHAQTTPWEPASEKGINESRADQVPVLIHQAPSTNSLSPILGTEALRRVWNEVDIRLVVVAPDLPNQLTPDRLAQLGIPRATPFAIIYPDDRPPRILPVELNQGQLIAALRDAHAAAVALRQPATPPASTPPPFQMDPALMRRYGLVASPGIKSPRTPRWEDAGDAALTNALRRGKPILMHWSDKTAGLPPVFSTPVATAALADFPGERLVLRPPHSSPLCLALLQSMGATNPPFTIMIRPDGKPGRALGPEPTQSALLGALNSAAALAHPAGPDAGETPSNQQTRTPQATNGIHPDSLRRWQLRLPGR